MAISSESSAETEHEVALADPKISSQKHCICYFEGCKATFSRPYRLTAHIAVHLGEKPFPCDFPNCDKAYTSSYHLRRHKLTSHLNVASTKEFKCEYEGCNAVFKLRQNERRHFRRAHEKSKTCPTCNKTFPKQSMLKAHQFYHTGESPYKCDICHVAFVLKNVYNRHLRKHREHLCPIEGCIETFETWSRLRKHLATHPPAFNCYYCKKGYRIKECLISHIRKHTIKNGEMLVKKKCPLKSYTCDLCSASIIGKASLRRHIFLKHEKPKEEKKVKVAPKPRAPRKDKDIPKKSMASILSSVFIDTNLEVKLLKGETVLSELEPVISTNQVQETQMVLVDGSASESDVPKEIEFNKF